MNTVAILEEVYNKINENPRILALIPTDDIAAYVLGSLYTVKSVYSPEQYQQTMNLFTEELSALSEAANSSDYDSFLSSLEFIIYSLKILPASDYLGSYIEEANFNKAYRLHSRNNSLVAIGDSHVNFFSGNNDLVYLPIGNGINVCPNSTDYNVTALHVGPCLAYNVGKPDSSQNFKNKMDYLVKEFIVPGSSLLFVLGEIDIRVHVKRQSEKQSIDAEAVIDGIIKEYRMFLCNLKSEGFNINLWSPIASQPDSAPIDPAFPRYGSEEERNGYSVIFANKLSEMCAQEGFGYFSLLDKLLDGTKTRQEYYSSDKVHLSSKLLPDAIGMLNEKGLAK